MLSLDKLLIKGFKSFVEPTEFEVKPGLTGIVGPNGCGKSNIVEAIRFGIGEVSAKQLRGKEIDDLIFNGTENRPSWNLAEVGLFIKLEGTDLESKFQSKQLEIARKIYSCLLYTSDAADDTPCVDLGGRRIIKKKK